MGDFASSNITLFRTTLWVKDGIELLDCSWALVDTEESSWITIIIKQVETSLVTSWSIGGLVLVALVETVSSSDTIGFDEVGSHLGVTSEMWGSSSGGALRTRAHDILVGELDVGGSFEAVHELDLLGEGHCPSGSRSS